MDKLQHKPRIAHITTIDMSIYVLLLNQLKYFQQAGYEVESISAPGPYVKRIEEAGIRHHSVPMTRRLFTPFQDLRSLIVLVRLLRSGKYDLVHVHTPKASFLGQIAARIAGVRVIVRTVHGYYFNEDSKYLFRKMMILLEKVGSKFGDIILSQTEEDIHTAIEEKICSKEKIEYLGNGIDLDLFDPDHLDPDRLIELRKELDLESDSVVIGFVGRLAAYRKGVIYLLEAARMVVEDLPQARFILIGEKDAGKSDAVDVNIMDRSRFDKNFKFLGQIENAEMPYYYSLMDIFVLPSRFEGIPRSVMEASSMGIPSIVTDVRGNREVVEDQGSGFLVPYGDACSLAEKIKYLVRNRDLRASMGQRGREIAAQRFNEMIFFEKILDIYKDYLD